MQDILFSNDPLDANLFQYVDGKHIEQHHIHRAKTGKMIEEEERMFFHHLDECSLCAQKFQK